MWTKLVPVKSGLVIQVYLGVCFRLSSDGLTFSQILSCNWRTSIDGYAFL